MVEEGVHIPENPPHEPFLTFNIAIGIIPKFDGNPNHLSRFISTCETILRKYYNYVHPASAENQIILYSILNKLDGRAEEVINISGEITSWDQIKLILLQHFGDQRDENCLNRDLVHLKQENESPQEFYNRCLNLLNTIFNYINLHENNDALKICKQEFFKAQTLKTFLAGLKDPLGSQIRSMKPIDLPTALQYIKEEQNIQYIQKKNSFSFPTQKPNFSKASSYQNQNQHAFNNRPIRGPFPALPLNRFNNNGFRPNHPNALRPFGQWQTQRPAMQNAFPPRPTWQQNHAFPSRPQFSQNFNRNNQPKPEPMSGISYTDKHYQLHNEQVYGTLNYDNETYNSNDDNAYMYNELEQFYQQPPPPLPSENESVPYYDISQEVDNSKKSPESSENFQVIPEPDQQP